VFKPGKSFARNSAYRSGCGVCRDDRAHNANVTQIHAHLFKAGQCQRCGCEFLDFSIGLEAGMSIDFGTDLQRLARRMQPERPGMQDTPGIAKTRNGSAVQQMRIDTRHLRRHIRAQPHRPSRQLVDQLEGSQVRILSGARHQGVQVFQHRRHD
jgi:hypothetical protein